MVVTHNDILNAIVNAENIAFMYSQARVNTLSNGILPTAEQNAAIIELEAWINILEIAEAQWEEGCITSDDTWQVIQNINELSQRVPCNVSRTFSRNSSSGGGESPTTGYVERVFAYLVAANNPDVLNTIVDNSNPSRPIIKLFIDGITLTGTGTEEDPLNAVGGGGTVISVNGLTGAVVLTTTDINEGTRLYFTTARVLATALSGLSITGGTIASTDTILQAFGKLQNQINSLVGGVIYQGTWNASTNTPTLTSSVGTKGYYYVVNVAGSTNLDGNTDWEIGDWAIFNGSVWQKVDNTDASAGNTTTTPITAAALLALQTGSDLSTTTIYVVTDAPLVISIMAESVSQLSQTGTVIDANYSGTVYYDVATNTLTNGIIFDTDENTWIGCLPTDTTLGASSEKNTFYQGVQSLIAGSGFQKNTLYQRTSTNTFGDDCINNTVMAQSSGFIFGDNLNSTTIEAGLTGADYTASPDYDFLYNNTYPSTIFTDGTDNYHRYYDPANDRIVVTLMASPFTVSYIGGSGGSGDVVGPASAVNNNIVLFDGTTGKLIKDSGAALSSKLDVAAGSNYRLTASDGSGNRGNISAITASRALKSDGNGIPTHFDTATEPSLTELSYVKGVTSAIQTQLDALSDTYAVFVQSYAFASPADSTSYHFGIIGDAMGTTTTRREFKFTKAGNVTEFSFNLLQTNNGSSETVNIYLRNTSTATDTSIGTFTSDFGASGSLKTLFSGLSIAVNTTDNYVIKITTPAWSSNPTSWIISGLIQVTI